MGRNCVGRAAAQNVSYMELILNPAGSRATTLGARLGWDENFDSFRKKVDENGAAIRPYSTIPFDSGALARECFISQPARVFPCLGISRMPA